MPYGKSTATYRSNFLRLNSLETTWLQSCLKMRAGGLNPEFIQLLMVNIHQHKESLSWFGVGEEMALTTLEALGHNYLMLPVYRGWARVSKAAFGQRPDYVEHGALDEPPGMIRIRTMAKRVVEISRKMKFA